MAQRDDDGEEETTSERGVQYPSDSLADAIAMIETVREAVGMGVATREIMAQALGYSSMSGRAARKLGALSHYGLIERSGRGAARISELGKSILMPRSDAEKAEAIVRAAKTPKLFGVLISKYTGHAIPTLLPNLLAREHGVHPNVAGAAAATFKQTVEFAGLLRNGVLQAEPATEKTESKSDTPGSSIVDEKSPPPKDGSRGSGAVVTDAGDFTIPLDRTGRVARISLPLPVSERDLRKVSAWVEYMTSTIEDDENDPAISGN